MYCKFCGKKIEDDSISCEHCGKNLESENNKETTERKKSFHGGIILIIIFALILIIVPITINKVNSDPSSDTPTLITRNITKSDYSYTTSQDLTSYSITILPELDFKSCTIELTLYNSKNKKIFSDTLTKSNLRKNSSYTYTFQFGFMNSLSGNSISFNVTGKCSTFQ